MDLQDSLEKIGLNKKEVKIYLTLLENGELKISELLDKTALARGDLYYALDNLVERGLVAKEDKLKKLHFRLAHPNKLVDVAEAQKKRAEEIQEEIRAIFPGILSRFNLNYHQPGVKVFEGDEAVDMLLHDSLKAQGEIVAFIDIETINKYLGNAANRYSRRREELGLKKYNLVLNSAYNTEYIKTHPLESTYERLIDLGPQMAGVSIQVYDNKVAIHTFKPEAKIGLVIEDVIISGLMRSMFWWMWERSSISRVESS